MRGIATRKADVVGTRSRSATKMAKKRLSEAGNYLSKDLYTAFYEELHKTLLSYVSDKLNMDMADMSKENIASRLAGEGVPEPVCAEFVSLLDACEFARYAPSAGHEAMSAHYEKAVSVISLIDDNMKKSNRKSIAPVLAALLVLLPMNSFALNDERCDSLWNAGVSAYSSEDWAQAAADWISIYEGGFESPELYCNIGNAYFKQREYAKAILFYERSLKLDPSYSDAKYNLDYLNSIIQDKVEPVPEFFLKTWVRNVSYLMPSSSWAVLFLVLLAITLSMVLVFVLASSPGARKAGFFSAVAAVVLSLCSLGFSLGQRSEMMSSDAAIIMSPVASVKSSPGYASVDLFVLHEGTRVKVLETVGEWSNVELADGRQGWMMSSDAEYI